MIPAISVALVIRLGNKVLWKRSDADAEKRTFPRGLVKPYEPLRVAGARIAKEQTGLTVDVTQSLYTQETIDEENFAHEIVLYLGCAHRYGLIPADDDRLQWVTGNMLKQTRQLTDAAKDAVSAIIR